MTQMTRQEQIQAITIRMFRLGLLALGRCTRPAAIAELERGEDRA